MHDFKTQSKPCLYTQTRHFSGTRNQTLKQAAEYALIKIPFFHKKGINGG